MQLCNRARKRGPCNIDKQATWMQHIALADALNYLRPTYLIELLIIKQFNYLIFHTFVALSVTKDII